MNNQVEKMAEILKRYTKEKHIMASFVILEEYADVLYKAGCRIIEEDDDDYESLDECIADNLYNAGCRMQTEGEWISVKDRLPEETQGFLVVLNNEDIDIRVFNSKNEPWQTYSSMLDKFLFLNDKGEWHTTNRVTHWMPLPKPPKMKGGAKMRGGDTE